MSYSRTKYVIDAEGYRPNVGIIVCNNSSQVLWARRASRDGWQFPQGGMEPNESAQEAAYRELQEEVGLLPQHVRLAGRTQDWLRYDVPRKLLRRREYGFCGQKQIWFLFHLIGTEDDICLDACDNPEFDAWRWVNYWDPLQQIVKFKRYVYEQALIELKPYLSGVN